MVSASAETSVLSSAVFGSLLDLGEMNKTLKQDRRALISFSDLHTANMDASPFYPCLSIFLSVIVFVWLSFCQSFSDYVSMALLSCSFSCF